MGVKLIAEVLDHAPADWTPAERVFVAVLAEKARDSTRRAWPGQATIARRTGLKPDSVTRLCHRLAAKGWELRESRGTDKNGKPIYAHNGQAAVYVIPRMCPLGEHDPDVCFPNEGRTTVRASQADPQEGTEESPDDGPGMGEESPDGGPGFAEKDPDGGPGFTAEGRTVVRERPDGGPPLTVTTPQTSTLTTAAPAAGKESLTPSPSTKPKIPRQPALLTKTAVRLPQATQIVLDGLHADGHPDATADDATAVHRAVVARYGRKVTLQWLRTMASNRSFEPFYAEIRTARAEQVEAQIFELQRTEPACEHNTAAGRALHPTTGLMLCPMCRDGRPPLQHRGEQTNPAVRAALDAYRRNATGRLNAITLMQITREATVLHNRRVSAEQLANLAAKAAQANVGLLIAATAK